ncbi:MULTISPECIES: cell wall anchor protein [Chryseobacterium]|uniref:Cell wall anchor protein n=1 Tax=Chryseobacterium camelliae TaxID=1265445 RepID=A0ABU0TJ60_9FLAO|nr:MULTISPECIES: cell wall anchor protein [Chryseobacterium]MDT3409040.1 hypothetical protein [Pseudacidovorax intermedius]MDQ1097102.1 hypothetical protein [Chryseobacterium camelliae]MDQ1101039.1 hypothetical protein [Chryseobacterium sp. SORGH_AS_1048]MDR6084482.1 hypothetical protein [Chryseobacterium sp. SORGH_AS_0909]MDR6132752.1 hypothetical protein [Chryseobacterium sp. SORGH_AS_1175]
MKKQLLALSLLTSIFTMAQQADRVFVHDSRNTNDLPSAYSRELRAEFKDRSVIGVPGSGTYSGMLTISPWQDSSGNKNHQLNFNDGGVFFRSGLQTDNYWGTWNKLVMESNEGKVRIGLNDTDTTSPALLRVYSQDNSMIELANAYGKFQIAKSFCNGCYGGNIGDTVLRNNTGSHTIILALPNNNNDGSSYIGIQDGTRGTWVKFLNNGTARIDGKVYAKEVEVKADVWADYVFDKHYKLNTLEEIEKHIAEKGHLPNIPSAAEVEKDGINLAKMDAKLLEKIEELTLYSIEQNKQIKKLQQDNEMLKLHAEELKELKRQIQELISTKK